MKCYRCGGTMVSETFFLWDDYFSGWRCIICGEIIDPLILENRAERARLRKPLKASMRKTAGMEERSEF